MVASDRSGGEERGGEEQCDAARHRRSVTRTLRRGEAVGDLLAVLECAAADCSGAAAPEPPITVAPGDCSASLRS